MTVSKLVRAILAAHLASQRPRLRQAAPNAALIREINRIGVNINQLARAANTPRLTVPEAELRRALLELSAAITRL